MLFNIHKLVAFFSREEDRWIVRAIPVDDLAIPNDEYKIKPDGDYYFDDEEHEWLVPDLEKILQRELEAQIERDSAFEGQM